MIYWFSGVVEILGGPAIFRFLTSRALFAFITAMAVGLLVGRPVIHLLYRKGMRSKERKYQAMDTGSKVGTPVMGGLILFIAGIGSALLWCDLSSISVWLCIAASTWFGLVGAIDDVMKVRGGAEKGMSRPLKLIAQLGFGAGLGMIVVNPEWTPFPLDLASDVFVPFRQAPLVSLDLVYLPFLPHAYWNLSFLYAGLAAFFLGFCTNAVNFTDGLDGLTTVPCLLSFAVLGVFAYMLGNIQWSEYLLYPYLQGSGEIGVFCAAMMGACLAFLWFNVYPADVFMGDMGSLMLGGALGTVAILLKQEALMFIVGGVFLIELGSSALQEQVGLKTGRRIFAAAPLHHLFQHRGIAESKIVVRMWIVSVLFAALALSTLKIR